MCLYNELFYLYARTANLGMQVYNFIYVFASNPPQKNGNLRHQRERLYAGDLCKIMDEVLQFFFFFPDGEQLTLHAVQIGGSLEI